MRKKTIGTDFTNGSVVKHLIIFLTPLLLANVLNSIYNTVDMIIIGQFAGSAGIVAVSQGGKLLNVFTHVSMSLSGAGQIIISQQIGAKQKEQVSSIIGTLFSLLVIIAIVISTVCLVFSRQIILMLNTPPESYASALSYLRITSAGFILMYGYNAVSSVLRGMGESKMPLLFITIAAVINIILDLILIAVFDMGAVGTAIATVTGQGVSLIFSIGLLYKRREHFGFDFKYKSFIIKKDKMKMIFKLGIPMAASAFCIQFTQLIMISFVNQFGLVQAAAYGIGDKVIHLTNVVSQSTRQAGGAMVAQNLGAERKDRVKEIVHSALKITLGFATILAVFALLFPKEIFSIFTNDTLVLEYSKPIMVIASVTFFLAAMSSSFDMVTMGSGNTKLAFVAGFIDGVILRISLGLLFGRVMDMQSVGFFLGHSLARLSPLFIHGTYYFSGAWRNRRLVVLKEKIKT